MNNTQLDSIPKHHPALKALKLVYDKEPIALKQLFIDDVFHKRGVSERLAQILGETYLIFEDSNYALIDKKMNPNFITLQNIYKLELKPQSNTICKFIRSNGKINSFFDISNNRALNFKEVLINACLILLLSNNSYNYQILENYKIKLNNQLKFDSLIHSNLLRSNILIKGLTLSIQPNNPTLTLYQIEDNPILNQFNSNYWDELLEMIGPVNMTYLLLNSTIFQCSKNSNLIQISGPLKLSSKKSTISANSNLEEELDLKILQMRLLASIDNQYLQMINNYFENYPKQDKLTNSPNSVVFTRYSIFYSRFYLNQNFKVRLGLSSNCCLKVLNTIDLSYFIFPLEFDKKLVNLPIRLLNINFLIAKIQEKFLNFEFNRIIKIYCKLPIKINNETIRKLELNDLVKLNSNEDEVVKVVTKIIDLLIPKSVWGSLNNWNIIKTFIREFVKGTRFENFSLNQILKGFKINDCKWTSKGLNSKFIETKFGEFINIEGNFKVSKIEFTIRKRLVNQFLFWLVEALLIPLLKTTFHITEGQHTSKKLLYYRQDIYKLIEEKYLSANNSIFEPIPLNELKELPESINLSKMRLLPKGDGTVRPIAQLGTKLIKHELIKNNLIDKKLSINSSLRCPFLCMKYEMSENPDLTKVNISGPQDLLIKLQNYKDYLVKTKSIGNKLYFVKFDIEKCFDNISRNHLISIVKDFLNKETYKFIKTVLVQLNSTRDKLITRYNQFAIGGDKQLNYKEFKTLISTKYSKSIVQCPVTNMKLRKKDMIKDVINLLNYNILKFGTSYLHQVNGIPQGSIISNLLCNLYYGKFESKFLSVFIDDPQSCLMRATDDILFISSDLEKAKEFYSLLSSWNDKEFILKVNLSKTKHNLKSDSDIKHVNWCGLHISFPYIDISADIHRMLNNPIRDTITSNLHSKPGESNLKTLINGIRFSIFRVFIINSNQTSMFSNTPLFNLKRNLYLCLLSQFNRFLVNLELFPKLELNYLLKAIGKATQLLQTIFRKKSNVIAKKEIKLGLGEVRRLQLLKSIQKIVIISFYSGLKFLKININFRLKNCLIYHLTLSLKGKPLNCTLKSSGDCGCTRVLEQDDLELKFYLKGIDKGSIGLLNRIKKY